MYRLLTINRVALENCRQCMYGQKKHVLRIKDVDVSGIVNSQDTSAPLLQPVKYQTFNNGNQRAVYSHLQQNIKGLQLTKPTTKHNGVVAPLTGKFILKNLRR